MCVFVYCLLHTHWLPQSKMSEIIAKNVHKQQAALLEKSFISTDRKQLSICYKRSVGSHVSYS